MCFHTIYSSCDLKAQLNALKYSYAELIQGSCGPKEKYVWTSTSSGEEGPCGAECVVEKLIPKMLHPRMRLEAIRTQPHIQMHHILYYLLQAIAGLAERKPPHLTNKVGKLESHGKPVFSRFICCFLRPRTYGSNIFSHVTGITCITVGVAVAQKYGETFCKTTGQSSSRRKYSLNLDKR